MDTSLDNLGYNSYFENYRNNNSLQQFNVARVILVHKDRYIILSETGEFDAELIGNLRFMLHNKEEFPAVGDWVAFAEYDEGKALIHSIFDRQTIIQRQEVGAYGEIQIIASNIDYGFIIQSVNRDFSINRLERYISICHSGNVTPIVILSKVDLISDEELNQIINSVNQRINNIDIIALSNDSLVGLNEIKAKITAGKSYCLLGSSGVGKSTLLNNLAGDRIMETAPISESVDRGKHITSHRELFILKSGGIIIDNPGMREVGMAEASEGLNITFESIIEYTSKCKFKDCNHTNQKGCAVLKALKKGEIDEDSYDNFLKMQKENEFFESSNQDKKRKDKNLGKVIKAFKQQRNNPKY